MRLEFRTTALFLPVLFLAACAGKPAAGPATPRTPGTTVDRLAGTPSQEPAAVRPEKKAESIAGWLRRNLHIEVDEKQFAAAGITRKDRFSENLEPAVKKRLLDPNLLGEMVMRRPTVEANNTLFFDLSSDVDNRRLFITERYIIVSNHGIIGTAGEAVVYDLEKKTLAELAMTVMEVLPGDELEVGTDYYVEGEGHVWETGSYSLRTKKYRKISVR